PHLARLSFRLLLDPRVPTRLKALTVAAIALIISPLDLPNWIPVLGQGFDVVVIVTVLDRFIGAVPAAIVREHEAALGMTGNSDSDYTRGPWSAH
ncbi:MAG: hypothetical protein LC748_15180, partial [Thermomicrobia bacterium]|nr:hypothetical protein [Thermomicrobia bacterium]